MNASHPFFDPPPPEKVEPPDWWNLLARERGCPAGWCWTSLETIDTTVPRTQAQCLVTGAVYSTPLKAGPRKGKPNPKKPDAGTERRLVISFAEVDARVARWECETGKCGRCGGGGEESAGWSAETGSRWKPCGKCAGTGKAVTP